ncbi:MAG: indolepyruvate oxidoreductase subunit beta family protein [Deltaproteobacteria bacterium]|nr:indolepyruvate oxidoreductase subunit beta family protein [Deltaproteobacteria bacterium]
MTGAADRPISIAIAALGGQGGGVLAQWLTDLAEANGCVAQSTSVPGVAQRTGATIYYVELLPEQAIQRAGRSPVLALMPAQGHVDICIASELIEGGRAIARGFVTPDRTTLILSENRIYAISEKEALGDGRADPDSVRAAAQRASRNLVMFDMQKAADEAGSAISAVLFGALAGSGALPFRPESYRDTIRRAGRAVEANLRGLDRGLEGACGGRGIESAAETAAPASVAPPAVWAADFPGNAHDMIARGVERLCEYQDRAYAELYLQRLQQLLAAGCSPEVLRETARHLALWMSFEDVIRVADLKVRGERFAQIREEVRAAPGQLWYAAEYMHPRYEEFCGLLPAPLGSALSRSGFFKRLFSPIFSRGRILQTGKLGGFLLLYLLAGLRRWRRGMLRYRQENALIEDWLARVQECVGADSGLALEIARCPRLIKGYGDTHARGLARFLQIMERVGAQAHSPLDARSARALREAALADEDGSAFAEALRGLN